MMLRLFLRALRGSAPSEAAAPALTPESYDSQLPIGTLHEGATAVRFCLPNAAAQFRVDSFFTKEPDTVEWIRGFQKNDVLLDVGANVGMYTIWAARTRGAAVYAFEPESQNYALLCRNIVVNDVGDRVTAYCVALSDEERFSLLHLSDFFAGGSCHTFGAAEDFDLKPRAFRYTQGSYSTTLDALVERGVLPVPTHVKIDVDGIEHKVIAGARKTLRDPRVKSLLIEVNSKLAEHRAIVDEMHALGFRYSEAQVAAARRTQGVFAGTGNYVFQR